MLTYPIRTAAESGLFESVVVSTEDAEIAELADAAGARVLARPDDLAQDRSTVVQVCLHALDALEAEGNAVEEFCCIYATAIFLTVDDLRRSYELLHKPPMADFVMGVSEYDLHPVQALKETNGFLEPMWPEYRGLQSQFYPKLVASNGTLYWAKAGAFRQSRSFYGTRLKGYEIARSQIINIDTPDDLKRARLLAAAVFAQPR